MNPNYRELLARLATPRRVPWLVVAPSFVEGRYDSHAVDGPFVFRYENRFYLMHIGYDGIGYRTGLAASNDLEHWSKQGMILDRGPVGTPTEFNAALLWIVRDNELFGPGDLKRINGRLLGTYHAYPAPGYEVGPASIGLGWSDDLVHWQLLPFCLNAHDGAAWERGGLYKSCLVEHEGTFYMFYNAKNQTEWPWYEQIGLATSQDLNTWTRYPGSPILPVGPAGAWDERFASDPYVLRAGDIWVMFYYGLAADGHARDGVAFSSDLLHWEKAEQPLIDVGAPGSLDSQYAHKPAFFYRNGRLYHFYCAVSPALEPVHGTILNQELRGIGLRTSI